MKAVAALALASLVAGCAYPERSGNVYQSYQAQTEQVVRTGTVESVRNVSIENPQSGVGAMGGAALGGLAGSAGGEGTGQAALVVAGALVGGLLGQHAEHAANKEPGLEITVRLDNGEVRAITQTADEAFHPGERVRLLSDNYTTRVTH